MAGPHTEGRGRVIESLITIIRQLHPQPWTSLEVYLAVLGAVVLGWVAINGVVACAFAWSRHRQIMRILQEGATYHDPSIPLERDHRDQALVRPPDRGADVSPAATGGVDGASDTPVTAYHVSQFAGRAIDATATTLVDPRVAGYARGTSLEAPAEDRVAEPQCTGPFSDAFDCPVHNPRRRTVAERTR